MGLHVNLICQKDLLLKRSTNSAIRMSKSFPHPTHSRQVWEQGISLPKSHCSQVKSTKEWFRKKRIPILDWPANNLDANLIENLWRILKRTLRKYCPSKLGKLEQVIIDVWASGSPETSLDLIDSLTRTNEGKSQCKKCNNKVLSVLIQFFKYVH